MRINKIVKTCLLLPCFFPLHIFGQGLTVGDYIPALNLKHVIHAKTDHIDLAALKNKIIVFDFWATYCGSCIEKMPELDSLQQLYKDRLIIIPVTTQDQKHVGKFISTHASLNKLSFPFVTKDSTLIKLFPHNALPHEVIIGSDSKIKAITDDGGLNKKILDSLINGFDVHQMIKKDVLVYTNKPFLLDIDAPMPERYYFESKGIPGYKSLMGFDNSGLKENGMRFRAYNQDALSLIKFVTSYINKTFLNINNRIIYENGVDSTELSFPSNMRLTQWQVERSYCIDLIHQSTTEEKFFDYLHKEIEQLVNLKFRIEKRKVKCYVVTSKLPEKYIASNTTNHSFDPGTDKWVFQSILAKGIFDHLNEISPIPVCNETGFHKRMDFKITPNFKNFTTLQSEFESYGMELQYVDRELPMIIISK